jgi:Xaa-Pro aminopeptidase
MRARIERLQALLPTAHLDALLVTNAHNRRYLTGFTGSAGTVVVSATQAWLAVDFRYWQRAAAEAPDIAILQLEPMTRFESALPKLLDGKHWQRVGVEAGDLTLAAFDRLTAAVAGLGIELVPVTDLVEKLRGVKDASELASLEQALALTDDAMAHARTLLKPGVTERAVAWAVEVYMREHGASGLAFDTIVAFGPHSALPHHTCSDRALQAGEPIVIDMGALVDGYCGDLTRTFCLPPVDALFTERYQLVLDALLTTERELKAGVTGRAGDALGRDVIASGGLGATFGHSLGHSVGLFIHEAPNLSRLNEEPLSAGAVVTIEPGVYIPGWGGIRIEDVVVVEATGVRVLTGAPKQPLP